MLELAALGEYHSTHPIAMSVKKAYGKEIDTARIGQVEEIPGHGIHARVQAGGAWHELFIGNRKLMERQQVIIDTPSAMMGTTLYLADETGYLGAVVISDRIREDVPAALAGLRRQGVAPW